MSEEIVKLAFVGCGGIARRHVKAMKDLVDRGRTGFTVTAVCDNNVEAAQNLAEELHELLGMTPRIYNDHQAMLTAEALDGADLCLPHGLHHGFTVDFMEAGVHVLTEKPIGVSLKAGQVMEDAAARTGKILSIAVPHRRQPGQRAVHWVLNESKLIGNPLTFFHNYTRPPAPQQPNAVIPERVRWRRDRMMSGGGSTLMFQTETELIPRRIEMANIRNITVQRSTRNPVITRASAWRAPRPAGLRIDGAGDGRSRRGLRASRR